MGDWDKGLKTLVAGSPQAFAEWILQEDGLQTRDLKPTALKGYDLETDGLITIGRSTGEEILLLVEFQSVNDKTIGERLLEYSFRARREHGKPVIACVIFLRKDGVAPEPPLIWELRDGKRLLVFDYKCIKLWEMEEDELLALKQPALLPLTLLTKGGAKRTIVEKVFAGLLEHGLQNLLPASNLLAGLVLGKDDLEWLQRRYQQMSDILKESPVYQWMTDDAREEGLKEGLEQGHKKGREEGREEGIEQARQAELGRLRNAIIEIVGARFPASVRLAKKLVYEIEDADRLQHAIVKIGLAHDSENIDQYLWEMDEAVERSEQGEPGRP